MKWILLLFPIITFTQEVYYENLKELSEAKQKESVRAKIDSLHDSELCIYFKKLKEHNIALTPFTMLVISRAHSVNSEGSLYCITELLIEMDIDPVPLEKTLYFKKNIWDKGEWSQKFWKLIRTHKLLVPEDEFYTVDENGNKHYKLNEYIADKVSKGELGKNPLLETDYSLLEYTSDQLPETLSKLDIQDLQVVPKSKSTGLFGKRGVDGMLKVLTRNK